MTQSNKKPCEHNVYIFNNIKNNQEDVKLLSKTFKDLNCRTKVYQSLTLVEYEVAIQKICIGNFEVYDYIAIVVLDNTNPYNHILTTSDGQGLRINNDLLVRILQNKTLIDKKRLFLIQTNQVYSDEPPGPSNVYYLDPPENKKTIPIYAGPTIHFYATGPECSLEDHWPVLNSPPSPFIASFCKNMTKYAEEQTIQFIYDKVCRDIEKEDFIPVIDLNPVVKFGKALTACEIDDFFPEHYSSSSSSDMDTDDDDDDDDDDSDL